MTWTEYHPFDHFESYLNYLEDNYGFVKLEFIGQTYEKRALKVLKVCQNGCGTKPALWIDGGIHAREWISPATVTWLMKELIEVGLDRVARNTAREFFKTPSRFPNFKYTL